MSARAALLPHRYRRYRAGQESEILEGIGYESAVPKLLIFLHVVIERALRLTGKDRERDDAILAEARWSRLLEIAPGTGSAHFFNSTT
jgi:hypothetical protein